MGAQNTKTQNPPVPVQPVLDPKMFQRLASNKQKIYQDLRKMKKYNICPDKLTRVRDAKILDLIRQRRHRIKSLILEANSPILKNQKFLKALPYMTNLKGLEIELTQKVDISQKEFQAFARTVGKMKHLEDFNITCYDPARYSSEKSATIMLNVGRLTRLRKLDLRWTSWVHEDQNKMRPQSYILEIPQYAKIETFKLDISTCRNLSDDMLIKLAHKLESMKSLRDLVLNFMFTEGNRGVGLRHLLESIAKHRLKTLNLKFGGFGNISTEEMTALRENIRRLDTLETISLTFEGIDDIIEKGLDGLLEVITQLKRLKDVRLNFTSCQGLKRFDLLNVNSNNAQFIQRILCLHLIFKNCSFDEDSVIHLSEGLAQFINLKELLLDFEGYKTLGKTVLGKLSKNLSQIKLRSLYLNFSKSQVNDSGFLDLVDGISNLNELERLGLLFACNADITNKGIWELNILKTFARLAVLHLDFRDCNSISYSPVVNLLSALEKIKTIMEIRLEFQSRNMSISLKDFVWKYNNIQKQY